MEKSNSKNQMVLQEQSDFNPRYRSIPDLDFVNGVTVRIIDGEVEEQKKRKDKIVII